MAADDKGWIYFGVGHAASQIVALKPGAAQATLMITHPRKRGEDFLKKSRKLRSMLKSAEIEVDFP